MESSAIVLRALKIKPPQEITAIGVINRGADEIPIKTAV